MSNALGYPKLPAKSPVPSDIEVSQQIVKEVGLLPISDVGKQYVLGDEFNLHVKGCQDYRTY